MNHQRLRIVLAALAVAAAACGSDDDADPAATSPTPTTTAETSPTTGAEASSAPTTSAAPASTVAETSPVTTETNPPTTDTAITPVALDEAEPFTSAIVPIDSGTYRFDIVGTPVGLRIDDDEPWFVQTNWQGSLVLSHAESQGPDDRDLIFTRIDTLPDPDDLTAPHSTDTATRSPADDIDEWLASLPAGLSVSNVKSTTVGGYDATRFDATVAESLCEPGTSTCVAFAPVFGGGGKQLVPGSTYRVWMIDQPDEDPLAVIAAVGRSSDAAWLDTAQSVMSTVAFGEVAPNPIQTAPGGPIDLPFLGGIRIDVEEGARMNLGDRAQIGLTGYPAGTDFMTNPLDPSGAEIPDADALAETMTAGGLEVTETDPIEIGGLEARAFDFGGPPAGEVFGIEGLEFGWFAPERGRIWAIEHPDRGLLVVTAEASSNPDADLSIDTVFPLILARTETLLGSLEFV